mmetsp:Transcript_1396/g.3114  ORF Transcript_1396/g.3114 Transcript_1396/m.3114 type:complete len:207 (-) Transcript_1396:533-1153(-)
MRGGPRMATRPPRKPEAPPARRVTNVALLGPTLNSSLLLFGAAAAAASLLAFSVAATLSGWIAVSPLSTLFCFAVEPPSPPPPPSAFSSSSFPSTENLDLLPDLRTPPEEEAVVNRSSFSDAKSSTSLIDATRTSVRNWMLLGARSAMLGSRSAPCNVDILPLPAIGAFTLSSPLSLLLSSSLLFSSSSSSLLLMMLRYCPHLRMM